jgi:hypothetical protein
MLPFIKEYFDRVIIVDAISSYRDKLRGIADNVRGFNDLEIIDSYDNVTVYRHYFSIPNKICLRFPALYRFNYNMIDKALKTAGLNKLDGHVVVGTSHPYMYNGVINGCVANTKFYDCPDLHEEFPWSHKENSIELERKLIQVVDLFIASSNHIKKIKMHQAGKNAHVVTNGVTLSDFVSKIEIAQENKKVGYVGALEDWFDTDLLKFIITNNPHINFEIIGNIPDIKQNLFAEIEEKHQNVVFIGHVKHEVLYKYMKNWKIGIIPFKVNNLIQGVSPIKLFEYCSLGIETVSTHWDELKQYDEFCYSADNYDDFNRILVKLYNAKTEKSRIQDLIEFANKNSWSTKAREFTGLILNG